MSPVRVTWARTVGRLRSLYSTALAVGGFFAATGILLAFNIESAEGGSMGIAALWSLSVSQALPVLAAFLAMDVWSDERLSGRIDLLLSIAVRERDLVAGKFLGVLSSLVAVVVADFIVSIVFLGWFSPSALDGVGLSGFVPGLLAVFLQSLLWTAVSVAASAVFRHAATAAFSSLMLLVALPRGGWAAMLAWAPQGRLGFGEFPLDAHVIDMASGIVPVGILFAYVILTAVALFIASKAVVSVRFVGKGGRGLRFSTGFAIVLSLVFAGLAVSLVWRMNDVLDIAVDAEKSVVLSPRTRDILAEAHGDMTVTCFLSRKDPRFRSAGRFLRALIRESEVMGGIRISARFVDPKWDVGAAGLLVRQGAKEPSLVFERGRRVSVVPLIGGVGERECASAILSLTIPPQRRVIYWTCGHGELSYAEYGSWGMSDIARELSRDGYRNMSIDLATDASIPADCALMVIAGAKSDFSRVEIGRVDAFLKQGGRVLVLLSGADSGGVVSMLPSWGLRAVVQPLVGARTLSGSDVLVSSFADHPISAPLDGSQIVLERPIVFAPSSAIETAGGADRIDYMSLADVNGKCVAAIVERGVGVGADIAVRPTRLAAIGDAMFVMNGSLAARAGANRDFFLNCVAYLSGTDASVSSGVEQGKFVSGMDRATRLRFVVLTAAVAPAMAFAFLFLTAVRRRRRG